MITKTPGLLYYVYVFYAINTSCMTFHKSSVVAVEPPNRSRYSWKKPETRTLWLNKYHVIPAGGGCGGRGFSTYLSVGGVQPIPPYPNPGKIRKDANVYPGVNQISVSINYIYIVPSVLIKYVMTIVKGSN